MDGKPTNGPVFWTLDYFSGQCVAVQKQQTIGRAGKVESYQYGLSTLFLQLSFISGQSEVLSLAVEVSIVSRLSGHPRLGDP